MKILANDCNEIIENKKKVIPTNNYTLNNVTAKHQEGCDVTSTLLLSRADSVYTQNGRHSQGNQL